METIINNPNKLLLEDINVVTNKVRAIILDCDDNIIVTKYADMFMLPGGKVDNEEILEDALIRELEEELGIKYEINELLSVISYENYIENYNLVDSNSFTNKLNRTIYYLIRSDKKINNSNSKLSYREKNNGFTIINMYLYDLIDLVNSYESTNIRNIYFKKELLDVLDHVKNKILVKKR